MSKNYSQMSMAERRSIYKLLGIGKSKTEIAEHLGRHRSTIFREIQRNSHYHEDPFLRGYFHVVANDRALSRRTQLKKLLRHATLKAYVISKLQFPWTPEQISGHLKNIGIKGFYVCHETIYAFIYSAEGQALGLYKHLRRSFKKRRKRGSRKSMKDRGIPEDLSIHHRPKDIEDRDGFGHWEGDLVMFKREYGKSNITTLVERKCRYTLLLKNENKCSVPVMSKIRNKLTTLPLSARSSVTFDRGSEFLAYDLLEKHVEHGSFFCDPRAPWQKGTNENTNGRLRRFLPRKTDIGEVSQAELNVISNKLNHTPRKCLGYKTPHEVFHNHLHQTQGQIACIT